MVKKKGFLDVDNPAISPAMTFISGAQHTDNAHTDNTDNTHTDNTHTDNADTRKAETKSRRLNLLMFPSVAEDLEKIAVMKHTSLNNLINEILRDYAADHSRIVEGYNKVFEEVKKD